MTNDNDLVARLKRRDHRGYMQLFDDYFKPLHRFATRLVGDHEAASDIVQSVFIALYERAHRIEPDIKLAAWLTTATRNRCLNYLRDLRVELRDKALYLQAYEEADALEYLDDEALILKIREIMQELPGKCREICELRFYHNLKLEEIAERLSLSLNTVKVQLHRGVRAMKARVASDPTLSITLLILFGNTAGDRDS
jgi:RNA polymerase sigma-70 factor (ECF subfamily)